VQILLPSQELLWAGGRSGSLRPTVVDLRVVQFCAKASTLPILSRRGFDAGKSLMNDLGLVPAKAARVDRQHLGIGYAPKSGLPAPGADPVSFEMAVKSLLLILARDAPGSVRKGRTRVVRHRLPPRKVPGGL
jgi:hypothetical protein